MKGPRPVLVASAAAIILISVLCVIFSGGGGGISQSHNSAGPSEKPSRGASGHASTIQNQKSSDRSERPFSQHISLRARVVDLSWGERQRAFREALRDGSETPQSAWSLFRELEASSSEKIGPSGVAQAIFSEFSHIDPEYGIRCYSELGAGIVRERALLGLASGIPASAVLPLYATLEEQGLPEERRAFMGYLHSAAESYSISDLAKLLDSGILDEDARSVLSSYMKKKELLQKSGGFVEQAQRELALETFAKDLVNDVQLAADQLQQGRYSDVNLTSDLVRTTANGLVAADPKRAFEWAMKWENPRIRESALRSVVWSWVRTDPTSCTESILRVSNEDKRTRDIAIAEVVRYMLSRDSVQEAEEWAEKISDVESRESLLNGIVIDQQR